MNHALSLRVLALAALLVPATAIHASPITWSYDWSATTPQVNSDGGPSSHVVLTPTSGNNLVGSSDVIAANLVTFSKATTSNPAHFTNQVFTLDLVVTDAASSKTHEFKFTGEFEGTMTQNSSDLHIKWLTPKKQSFDLNHHVFTVRIDSFTPPGAPGSGGVGSIGARVSVSHNPEPGSLTLAGLGLALLGIRRRWYGIPC
jgi:uncharacterized protein (TIGR03382 family)